MAISGKEQGVFGSPGVSGRKMPYESGPAGSPEPLIHILYVDDDPEMSLFFKTFLNKMGGFEITSVGTGSEAISLLSSNLQIDIVISDYHMPGMNGIDLLKETRKLSFPPPFILFTGKGREEVVMEAINNGATFYLQKGGDIRTLFAELAHKIRQAVGKQHAEFALRESEEKFRLLFESARDAILIMKDGFIADCNKQASVFFRIPQEDLIGMTIGDLSPEKQPDGSISQELWETSVPAVIHGDHAFMVWRHRRSDGSFFDAEASLNRIDLDQQPCVQVVIRDITERIQAELELSTRNIELSAAYEELMSAEEERQFHLRELIANQERLVESEHKFRELADLLPQIVFECDTDGRITYANQQGYYSFGYTPGEIPDTLRVLDLLVPEDRERAGESLSRIRTEGQSHPHEYRAFRRDRSTIPVIIHSAPILKKGVFVGFRGIIIDITERKNSEEAVRISEEKYRTLVEHIQDGVFIIQEEGLLQFVNPAFASILGYTPAELTGKRITSIIAPEDRDLVIDRHIRRLSGESVPNQYEFRMLHADGRTRVLVSMDIGVTTFQGQQASIGTIRDVTRQRQAEDELIRAREELEQRVADRTAELTSVNAVLVTEVEERRSAEAALRESEERYRRLIELSPDAIFVHDGSRIIFVNPAGIRLLGSSTPDDIVGMGVHEIVYPDYLGRIRNGNFKGGTDGISGQTTEEQFIRTDGSAVEVEVSSAPIVYQGRPAILVIVRDITGRKRAAAQLQKYAEDMAGKNKELDYLANQLIDMNQDLDQRVRERTGQVLALMKQKDEFITQIGHDLKTPLTPLRALLPSLIEGEQNPETREALSVLLRSVHSIQDQTEKILTIARLSRDVVVVKPEPILVHACITESVQKNWLSVERKNLQMTVDIAEDCMVLFSHSDAGTVFDNLISNAVKYSNQDGHIRVSSRFSEGRVCILVADDGIGLSPDEAEHVFDEFYMVDSSRHDRSSSGLGLAIVRRLVHLYGGIVMVESKGKGMGAIFSVCLPDPDHHDDLHAS